MCRHVSMGLENRVSNPMKPGFLDCILHSMSLSESESDFEITPFGNLEKHVKTLFDAIITPRPTQSRVLRLLLRLNHPTAEGSECS